MNSTQPTATFFAQRWLTTFWHTIQKSFTDLNYYVDILNSPFKFSLKIAVTFYILIGIILSLQFGLQTIPFLSQETAEASQELINTYPEELIFNWENHQLSMNQDEPLVVHFPSSFEKPESWPKQLGLIDPNGDTPPENLSALLYVTDEALFVNSLQGTWTDTRLELLLPEEDVLIDQTYIRENVPNLISDIQSIMQALPFFVFPFLTVGIFVSRLVMIAIDSILLQVLFYFQRKPLPYHKAFQLSLHVLIPVETLNQITQLLYPDLNFPMLTIGYWTIMFLLVWHFRNLQMVKFEARGEK